MATERLRVILEMVTQDYKRGAKDAANATDGITKSGKAADKSVKSLSTRMSEFRKNAGLAAGAAGAAALVATFKDSVRAASDLGESINAVEKTFGDASDQVLAFSDVAARAAGLSKSAFNELATSTGSLLSNFGFSAREAASQAQRLTIRAADLASVFNTDVSDSLGAINAALRGETEPIRRFGISLSDAAIRAKAVELGLADTTSAVDANGKAVAALELIYEQSSKAAGDFAQTSDGLANSARIAAAEWENAKAEFGQAALPLAAGFLSRFNEGLLMLRADFSGAANQSLQFKRAMDAVNRALIAGSNPTSALQTGLFEIAENSDLTEAALIGLADAAGTTIEALDAQRDQIIENARQLGFSEEAIEDFIDALDSASGATDDSTNAFAQYRPMLQGVGEDARGSGQKLSGFVQKTMDIKREAPLAAASVRDLTSALSAQTSPVFRYVDALDRYEGVLEDIKKDGKITSDEEVEQLKAFTELADAAAALDDSDIQRFGEVAQDVLGKSAQDAQDLIDNLGILESRDWTISIVSNLPGNTTARVLAEVAAAGLSFGDPERAFGGAVSPSSSYIVGERGPELFRPSTSGRIESTNRITGATDSVVINLNVTAEPGFSGPVIRELDLALDKYRKGIA